FDRNERLFGTLNNGIEIKKPARIPEIKPDVIIISNFIYLDEIYDSIKHFEEFGIKVIKLHNPQDAAWVF
ncbi:MAG: hypothetical protein LBC27_02305, partial [Spirochaetaceae bacterium]|nr:hypothetical protein [Spirochaetaceae bacterium]